MASDDIWILGIHMTKFGKHPDKDTVDLAAEAALAALADGGVTMKDMGVLAAGNLMGGRRRHRPAAPEADRPDRHPRLQRGQRLRHRRHRAAHGDHGGQGRRVRHGPRRRRREAGRRRPARPAARRKADSDTWDAARAATARSPPIDGRIGTETMPGVFAQIGMEYGHKYGGTSFELFARISEKNHAHSTLNPLAAYQKRFTLERDHERRDDRLPEHPADVLGQLRRRRRRGGRSAARSSRRCRSSSSAGRSRSSASVLTTDPWQEACQVLPDVNTLTRNAAKQAYEQAGVGPEDLDLVELHDCFATAELVHYDNLMLCEEGGAVDFFESGATVARRHDAGERVGRPASRRATRSRPPASPTSGRSATTSAARPATARSRAPRSAWPTSSASARPAACTSWRSPPPDLAPVSRSDFGGSRGRAAPKSPNGVDRQVRRGGRSTRPGRRVSRRRAGCRRRRRWRRGPACRCPR